MLKTDKRLVVLCGSLLSLNIGESALICHGGKITRTGTVISIQADIRNYARFETEATRHCVVPVPDSASAIGVDMFPFYAPAVRIQSLPACA